MNAAFGTFAFMSHGIKYSSWAVQGIDETIYCVLHSHSGNEASDYLYLSSLYIYIYILPSTMSTAPHARALHGKVNASQLKSVTRCTLRCLFISPWTAEAVVREGQ